jgi:hypothetical protein
MAHFGGSTMFTRKLVRHRISLSTFGNERETSLSESEFRTFDTCKIKENFQTPKSTESYGKLERKISWYDTG